MNPLQLLAAIRLNVSGARGKSFAEVARQTGAYGAVKADTDRQVLEKFGDYAITENPGFQSVIPGPANSTYRTVAALRGAEITNSSAILTLPTRAGFYRYQEGNFTGKIDDYRVIQSSKVSPSVGAWVRYHEAIFAGNFGVVGDDSADDHAAIQSLIDLCEATGGRSIYFGAMKNRITAALHSHNVPLIWDPLQLDAGLRPRGSGYTALMMTGTVTDSAISIIGAGNVSYVDASGAIASDSRPVLNGLTLGNPDADEPLAASVIRSIRVAALAGFGVKARRLWDTTIMGASVQICGSGGDDGEYAFELISTDGDTCNELSIPRLQVEESVHRAIRIDARNLSSTFGKIHAERAMGFAGITTFELGGSGVYGSTRLQADNPAVAIALIAGSNLTFNSLRSEGGMRTYVNATNGDIAFVSPAASLYANPNQNGVVNVFGGTVNCREIGADWYVVNARVGIAEITQNAGDPGMAVFASCTINDLRTGSGNQAVTLDNTVATGDLMGANTVLTNGSSLSLRGGSVTINGKQVTLKGGSRLIGNVTMGDGALKAQGASKVVGNLILGAIKRVAFDLSSGVTGSVTGYGAPADGTDGPYLEPFEGMLASNLGPITTGSEVGRRFISGQWRAFGTYA